MVINIKRSERIYRAGSFNFTKAAEEKNAENLLVVRSKELANAYITNWKAHRGHSEAYAGR